MKRPKRGLVWRGFTLVELLLVISIIAILSTLSLAMIRTAQVEARTSAAEARIAQIQTILSIYVEDMEFRKLPFSTSDLEKFVSVNPITGVPDLAQVRNLRYRILADYINVEMPRDWRTLDPAIVNDVTEMFPSQSFRNWLGQYYSNPAVGVPGAIDGSLTTFLTSKRSAMINRWNSERMQNKPFSNQGELLYVLMSMIDYDGQTALETLGNGVVGDSDGDGLPEIVDPWGAPLEFAIVQRCAEPGGEDQWVDFPEKSGTTQFVNTTPETPYYYQPNRAAYPPNHLGWDYLDPTIPRRFEQFEFDVWSNNVGRPGEF